jgi:hypothetical protein
MRKMRVSTPALNSSISPFFPGRDAKEKMFSFGQDTSQPGHLLLSGLYEILGGSLARLHSAVDSGGGAEAGGFSAKEDDAADGLFRKKVQRAQRHKRN